MPKIVDHEERRSSIAAAAADVVAGAGADAVTMKSIADRAGVTTGALTHYFADKDQVMVAAMLHANAAMHERLHEALALGRSPVDALLAALPNDDAGRRDWLTWRAFGDVATRSESMRLHHRESMDAWRIAAAKAISERVGRSPDEVWLDAELVVAVVDAIGDAASIDPESWPIDRQRALLDHALGHVLSN